MIPSFETQKFRPKHPSRNPDIFYFSYCSFLSYSIYPSFPFLLLPSFLYSSSCFLTFVLLFLYVSITSFIFLCPSILSTITLYLIYPSSLSFLSRLFFISSTYYYSLSFLILPPPPPPPLFQSVSEKDLESEQTV